ncbi:AAA family ATPase [Mycobacterium sp. 1274756.6]|uniref:AAA family ATPase n=1 Tax=Mycobacterium sp. 1274756.6 TaxID=1834076 RepID=UPI000800725E|nr:AAA family ATPase [Mycobacterium sp. 1274756.6]OBJ70992.1 ATPase [Mycobacterium sp. 1274756.6]
MPNLVDSADIITRYLKARVPVIIVRTVETARALDLLRDVAARFQQMSFYRWSMAQGLLELSGQTQAIEDRSFVGALDYAAAAFNSRSNANFVFFGVEDINDDTSTARYVAEVARIANERQGSIIIVTGGQVWTGLTRLGMTVTVDLPDLGEMTELVTALVDDHRGVMPIEWDGDHIRQAAEILLGISEGQAVNAITTLLAKGSLTVDDTTELSEFKDQMFGEASGIERVKLKEQDGRIGGLSALRSWLSEQGDLIRSDLSGTALHPPKGVLLVGVPGCGKSLSAKAVASEWRLPLYRLDMASILGMYVGQSEGRLKEALDMADRVAPCVLWVDEIEKALAGSGGGDSGVTRRLIGQFLYWLQESTSKVFMVATSNDVSSLPPELLRKGRFDELFFVDLPDPEDRAEIIRLYFDRYLNYVPDPELLQQLVTVSEGFAGSDLEWAVHQIASASFRRREPQPSEEFVIATFASVIPFSRTNPEEVAAIRAWGKERAMPAGRSGIADAKTAGGGPRRVVVTG